MAPHQRRLGAALALAGFAFVLVCTLTPVSDPRGVAAATPIYCLVCGDQGVADVVVNLLLFIPFAAGLRLSGETWKRTVLAAFLISFSVELLQYWLIPGRDSSLSDLLTNTTSGAIGATIGRRLPRWAFPGAGLARALAIAWVAAILGVLLCWGWLLAPAVRSGRLMSRWAHEAPGRDVFNGRVTSIRLDGWPMPPDGTPPDSAALRRGLGQGAFSLDAEVISGRPVSDRLWIYMFRVPSGGVLTLNQRGRGTGVALPVRGLRYELHHPVVTLSNAFPSTAGVPVRLTAVASARRIQLSSAYGGVEQRLAFAVSPAFGWSLFVPFEVAEGQDVLWVTAAVLAAMLLPLGYWSAWARSPWAGVALVLTALLLALVAVPDVTGYPPVHWSEWLGGISGVAAGRMLHRAAASTRVTASR